MIYSVEVLFKKGPSFSLGSVSTNCTETAKQIAVTEARKFGFRDKVKKVTARMVQS